MQLPSGTLFVPCGKPIQPSDGRATATAGGTIPTHRSLDPGARHALCAWSHLPPCRGQGEADTNRGWYPHWGVDALYTGKERCLPQCCKSTIISGSRRPRVQQTVHCHGNVLQCERDREIAVLYSVQHRIVTAADTHWTGGAACVGSKAKVDNGGIVPNPEKASSLCRGCTRSRRLCWWANTSFRNHPMPPYHQEGKDSSRGVGLWEDMRALTPLTPWHTGSTSVHEENNEEVLPWHAEASVPCWNTWGSQKLGEEAPVSIHIWVLFRACQALWKKWQLAYPTSCAQQHPGVNKTHENWVDFSPGYILPVSCNQKFTSLQVKWLDSHMIVLGAFLLTKNAADSPACSSLSDSINPLLMLPPTML